MDNRLNGRGWRQPIIRAASIIVDYARGLFRFKARSVFRQKAIRTVIANMVETERMRLAATIGHRDHN